MINFVDVDLSIMQTGDILIGRRFSGDATNWMMLEGSAANHVAIIYRVPNSVKAYVLDCPRDKGLLWGQGMVRATELNDWLSEAASQDYEIVWLPLDEDIRARETHDEERLNNWFKEVQGSRYSSLSSFFAAVDTPDESFPAPFNSESLPINVRLYMQFKEEVPDVAET